MQVIPNTEASIVLLLFKKKNHSLELVKIEECPEKKRQSIARGKERLLVIGLAKLTLHINRQTERGKLKK